MELMNFKNGVKKYITNEIIPILNVNGFRKISGTKYVREKNGLLQFFYFRVDKYKLRPWFYFLPVFEGYNGIVTFGADGINIQDCLSPFNGYANIFNPDKRMDGEISEEEYTNKVLPKLVKLKLSIQNGILHEMDNLDSLDKFVQCCKSRGKIMMFDWADEHYFVDFLVPIYESNGMARMNYLLQKTQGFVEVYPKELRTFLEDECQITADDTSANQLFEKYCDLVRKTNKIESR